MDPTSSRQVTTGKRKRAPKISQEQKQLMVDYIEKNEKMVKGKFTATFTASDRRDLWNTLAELLNSCQGAKKTGKDWRKCWQDIRRTTKSKSAAVAKYRRVTGGGEAVEGVFGVEKRILSLIPTYVITGHGEQESTSDLSQLMQTQIMSPTAETATNKVVSDVEDITIAVGEEETAEVEPQENGATNLRTPS